MPPEPPEPPETAPPVVATTGISGGRLRVCSHHFSVFMTSRPCFTTRTPSPTTFSKLTNHSPSVARATGRIQQAQPGADETPVAYRRLSTRPDRQRRHLGVASLPLDWRVLRVVRCLPVVDVHWPALRPSYLGLAKAAQPRSSILSPRRPSGINVVAAALATRCSARALVSRGAGQIL